MTSQKGQVCKEGLVLVFRNEINFAISEKTPFLAVHLVKTTLPLGMRLQVGSIQAIMKHKMGQEKYLCKLRRTLPESLKSETEGPPEKMTSQIKVYVVIWEEILRQFTPISMSPTSPVSYFTSPDVLTAKFGHEVEGDASIRAWHRQSGQFLDRDSRLLDAGVGDGDTIIVFVGDRSDPKSVLPVVDMVMKVGGGKAMKVGGGKAMKGGGERGA